MSRTLTSSKWRSRSGMWSSIQAAPSNESSVHGATPWRRRRPWTGTTAGIERSAGNGRREVAEAVLELALLDEREADLRQDLLVGDVAPVVRQRHQRRAGALGGELPHPLPAGRRGVGGRRLPRDQRVVRVARHGVVGLVLATHVVPGHVHPEHVADLLDALGLLVGPDEAGPVELDVPLRVAEHVEDLGGRGVDGALDGDLSVVAHTGSLPDRHAPRPVVVIPAHLAAGITSNRREPGGVSRCRTPWWHGRGRR